MTDNTAEEDDVLRDMWFDPDLGPASENTRSVIKDVTNQVQHLESYHQLRTRRRRQADQRTFEMAVSTIVCNAVRCWLKNPDGWVALSLSKDHLSRRSRYHSPVFTKTLPDILKRLATPEMSFIELKLGQQALFAEARRTTIRAGKRLVTRINEHQLSNLDITHNQISEVLILKKAKQGYWDQGELVEYPDNKQTNALREEVHRINRWLAQADIQFFGLSASGEKVDINDRLLRRYFNNGSFQQGGRLFGGFWQPLGKLQRSRGLRINGEGVVTLDFGQMAPRILYGMAGVEPTQQDAYGLLGLESYRAGVKKVFNAILFADKPLARLPRGTRDLLPRRFGIKDVVELLAKTHEPLVPFFFTGIGHQLQYRESEILVDVLLAMIEKEIVGLPIHDAVTVAKSSAGEVEKIMLTTFKAHTGMEGVVGLEEEE